MRENAAERKFNLKFRKYGKLHQPETCRGCNESFARLQERKPRITPAVVCFVQEHGRAHTRDIRACSATAQMECGTLARARLRKWTIHLVEMSTEKSYKWTLRHGSRKEICPKCGQRRFVPYVLAADGETLAGPEYGRCDREQNCGYQRYPSDVKAKEVTPIERKPEQPLRFYPAAVQVDVNTNLFVYASKLCGTNHAMRIWQRYKIGRDGNRTVFWQIADDGSIRAGKSIPYKMDGHRDKTDEYPANWLHKSRAWDGMYTGKELQQCYFGEHLLKAHKQLPVVIVESEKTAAIMSEYSQSLVWLASGGSQGLKNEQKNASLKGRDVWLLPDNGQYWNWATTADKNGWHIFDTLEKCKLFEGCDILDLLEAGMFGAELIKTRL